MSCPICISDFNKSSRQPVECCHCQYTACKTCVRQYLIQTTHDAHCMHCRKKWDLEFMKKNLNANYVTGEYKEHRAKLLTDRVISQREEHYDGALLIVESRKLIKEQIEFDETIEKLENEILMIRRKIKNKTNKAMQINDYIYRGHPMPVDDGEGEGEGEDKKIRRKFLMPCQNTGCRGMLSQAYKCGLCENYTCSKCFEIKTDGHICDPNTVATAAEIKASSKPCPKCGERISKIDGCDQMWCVECKTAFSWSKGTIEQGAVHNPHYFQWLNTAGGAAICANGGIDRWCIGRQILNIQSFIENISYSYIMNLNLTDCKINSIFIRNIMQYVTHCSQIYLRNMRNEINFRTNDKHQIYNYFLGEYSEAKLQEHLSKVDIMNQRDQALCDIYDALILFVSQILQDFLNALKPIEKIFDEFIAEIYKNNPTYTNTNEPVDKVINSIISNKSYKHPNTIPKCVELAKQIHDEYAIVCNRFFNIFQKYTAYINAELIKYLIIYGLKRKVSLWDNNNIKHESSNFNMKNDFVEAEAHWRNIYNTTEIDIGANSP